MKKLFFVFLAVQFFAISCSKQNESSLQENSFLKEIEEYPLNELHVVDYKSDNYIIFSGETQHFEFKFEINLGNLNEIKESLKREKVYVNDVNEQLWNPFSKEESGVFSDNFWAYIKKLAELEKQKE